ncbi:MAG: TraR/DksA family transcriptional regulator [Geobacteraceae bacterium]|nr:TraR/DksA family transcriptional regulator [Geobacteraceae bacterium]
MPAKSKERQAKLRALLVETKRRLWNELRDELFRKTGEELHSQFELAQDPADMGLIGLLEDTGLAVADIRRQELTRMDEATNKLERGTYGLCEECGVEIDEKRLAVAPLVLCCLDCQKRREGPSYPPGVKI